MMSSRFTRRIFVSGAGAAAAATGIVLHSPRAAQAATTLVITDPGGDWQAAAHEAYYTPFQQASGIDVNFADRPSLALGQLKAMVDTHNVSWDVTELSDYLMYRAGKTGLLERLNYASMNTTGMLKDAMMPYGVGNDAYGTVIAYNTKKWPAGQGPKTWADFWDVNRFPGRRAMSGIGYGPLEFALLADGVPKDKIYPIDTKRALAAMNKIKPNVNVWWTTGAQQTQLMLDGEVDLIQGWNGRFYGAISKGAPYHIEWNQGMYQWEGWVVPKGTPRLADAQKFIEFAMRPKQQAIFAERIPYGPSNQQAFSYMPASRRDLLPTYGPNLKNLFRADAEWLSDNLDALTAAWTQWRAS
jgi:putative spermidine/putrescine transport system substrate-binding protein